MHRCAFNYRDCILGGDCKPARLHNVTKIVRLVSHQPRWTLIGAASTCWCMESAFSERIYVSIHDETDPIYSAFFLSPVLVFDVHLLHEIHFFFKNFHATICQETIKSYIKEKILTKLVTEKYIFKKRERKREKSVSNKNNRVTAETLFFKLKHWINTTPINLGRWFRTM